MAVRYVQRRLNGGGGSFEEVEPPPESLEVSKYLSSVQRFIKIRGSRCRSNRDMASDENMQTASHLKKMHPLRIKRKNQRSGEMVPGHTRQEWDAAFTYHVHGVVASSSKGFQTPSRAIVSVEPTSSESHQRKRRSRRLDLVLSDDHEKRPDWLPSDWQVEYRRPEGGATAGLTDRYYYEPVSRRQLRSKKEVLCYLETGARRSYKGKSQEKSNSRVNVTPSISTGLSEQNRSPLNFDFDNPPKKVTWVLNSFPEAPGEWTSFISGEMVPGHTRQQWDAAFTYHVHGVVASSSKVDDVGVNLEAGA